MDIDILVWLSEHRTPFFDWLFSAITVLGGEIIMIAIACITYWCISKRAGDRLLFTLFSGILLNQFLKLTFCVKRPWLRTDRYMPSESAVEAATGYSFPSGHTANAVAGYGGLAREKRLRVFSWALWALAALIGFSRLYLGVHTPQDVLVSFVIGAALVFAIGRATDYLYKNPKSDIYFALTGAAAALALTVYVLIKPYPDGANAEYTADALKLAGGALALFFGWLFERRKIGFQMPASFLKAALRAAGGLVLVLAVMKGLKAPLIAVMGVSFGAFARYALVGLAATVVWPYIYTKAGF